MERIIELLIIEMELCKTEVEAERTDKCDSAYNYWYGKYKGLEHALSLIG